MAYYQLTCLDNGHGTFFKITVNVLCVSSNFSKCIWLDAEQRNASAQFVFSSGVFMSNVYSARSLNWYNTNCNSNRSVFYSVTDCQKEYVSSVGYIVAVPF